MIAQLLNGDTCSDQNVAMYVYYKIKQKIIINTLSILVVMILFHIINQLMRRSRHCTMSVIDTG